ncbi:MAG: hypothetical protein WD993_01405 [Thermoleophilaceae bacterium]
MRLLDPLLALVAPPFCWSCGEGAVAGHPLCLRCRSRLRRLERTTVALTGVDAWAPLAYEGPARAVVRGLKFRGAARLAGPMAAEIVASAPDGMLTPAATLVPVPLHPRRARARGYNQAERLATAIGRRAGMRVDDCLRRRGAARGRQVGRGRAERLRALDGAVELRPGWRPPNRAVLVDDVATTGATLAACALALEAHGCAAVVAVSYAMTPGR